MAEETQSRYALDIRVPDAAPQRVVIKRKIVLGSDPNADVSITGLGLSPRHCSFRVHNDILSIHNLGNDTVIDKQELASGRMYIIDKGDKIKIGEMEIFIRKEKVALDDDEEEEEDNANTSITSIIAYKEKLDGQSEEKLAKGKKGAGSLFGKIFKGKSKPKVSPKSSVTVSSKGGYDYPGCIVRFLGVLLNFSLIYAILYCILPLTGMEKAFDALLPKILPLWKELMAKVIPLVPAGQPAILEFLKETLLLKFVLIYFVLELLGALFFGQGLALTMVGATGEGSFAVNRIKGVLRAVLSMVTTPLIIFDLPSVMKKRTLKDVLSLSHPSYSTNTWKFVSPLLFFPIIISSGLLSPIALDSNMLEYGLLSDGVSPKLKKSGDKAVEMGSVHFDFWLKMPPYENYQFLPLFKIFKTVPSVGLLIYDHKRKSKVRFTKSGDFGIKKALMYYGVGNPLFQLTHPKLYAYGKSKKGGIRPSKALTREFEGLLRDVYGLTIGTLHKFILRHGPFIGGAVNFRKGFLQELKYTDPAEFVMVTFDKKKYLQISPAKIVGNVTTTFFPINFGVDPMYKIQSRKKTTKTVQFLVTKFLPRLKWKFKEPEDPVPSVFSVIDPETRHKWRYYQTNGDPF